MTQLNLAASASIPAHDQRRGFCPTLREPMQTGDGLLARLRPVGGVMSPGQLRAVAALAERFGNGQIEVTARGNMQVRGVTAEVVAEFARGIEAVVAIESGLVIETSPLAGLDGHEIADPRLLAEAIRLAVANGALEAALGPKVTVVVDGGGRVGREALSADVRLTAVGSADAPMWALEVGGSGIGLLRAEDAAGAVWAALSLIARLGPRGRGRDLDGRAMQQALAPILVAEAPQHPLARPMQDRIELVDGRVGAAVGLAFGAANAAALTALANAAEAVGIAEFHLAPQHRVIAICAAEADAARFAQAAGALGFITASADPRRTVSACIGSEGCASGTIAARRVAETLARAEPHFFDGSFALHVSGCGKGCAHPGPSLLTLVGSEDGVDLVVDGNAKGAPALRMASDAVPLAMERLATLWRDERKLGESVASCFKRLGAASIAATVRQGRQ
ncbi:precorrin-3B synthase [Devosia sp. UYZn731]|uniref:precorrin-3B synthase n=1 Tax=Devosia sp. UYZn731 TaxID=3156345 RepID=UPI00339584C0